jgi:AcrR family transcriptional regulator
MVTSRERGTAAVDANPAGRLPAAERRALIEEAAARLFAQHGYAGTTVEEIVAAAGVSKPILYRHFESKRDLHVRLLERRRDELAAAPLDSLLNADGPIDARLEAMLDTWFAHVEQHSDSSRLLFVDIADDAELRELQQELRARQRAADMALLREHDPPPPEHELEPLGEIVRSSLTGLALWWLDRPHVPRATVVAAMLRMLRGLLAPR